MEISQIVSNAIISHEKQKDERVFKVSNISDGALESIIGIFDIDIIEDHQITAMAEGLTFNPFEWKKRNGDDADAMHEASNHVETELRKFHVPFGLDNYILVDVHKDTHLLNIDNDMIKIRGGTDLIITSYSIPASYPSRQLCVIFELKTTHSFQQNLNEHSNQAIVELIAARCKSNQPGVLVVLTDLARKASTYELAYNATRVLSLSR